MSVDLPDSGIFQLFKQTVTLKQTNSLEIILTVVYFDSCVFCIILPALLFTYNYYVVFYYPSILLCVNL